MCASLAAIVVIIYSLCVCAICSVFCLNCILDGFCTFQVALNAWDADYCYWLLLLIWALSVRQSVCHVAQLGFTVHKQMNGSRCWLGWTLLGLLDHCVTWFWSHSKGRGIRCSCCQILWLLVLASDLISPHARHAWYSKLYRLHSFSCPHQ